MAEQDIIQNMISRLGQSQADRLTPELNAHFVDVDERDPRALLAHLARFAGSLGFYSDDPTTRDGDWSSFFPPADQLADLLERRDGAVPPHLGLLIAFLRLYDQFPRRAINELTGKHLAFQFQRVLRFAHRPAEPDHAHLVVELKKGAAPLVVPSGQEFSAGKDDAGVERAYQSARDVVINHGQVVAVKSVFHDGHVLRCAQRADSADGLDAPLDAERPSWSAFGHARLKPAQIGFALASPVLRMAEGTRTIRVDLRLSGLDPQRHTSSNLASSFTAYVSGPQGWVEVRTLSAERSGNRVTWTATLTSAQPAVVDYDGAVHGGVLAAQSPVLQLLLRPDGVLRYQELAEVTVDKMGVRVQVDGLTRVDVENDFGKLNARKAFQPFGPQPTVGARFQIGCEEALAKRLRRLVVKLSWQGAPPNLADWYQNYPRASQFLNGVGATVVYQDRGGQAKRGTSTLLANAATAESTIDIDSPPAAPVLRDNPFDGPLHTLAFADSSTLRKLGVSLALERPLHRRSVVPAPEARAGFITIALTEDFLHAEYRQQTLARLAKTPNDASAILNEPYTPLVRSIRLQYDAESDEVDLNDDRPTDDGLARFANADVQFFQIDCFGQMREHAYARAQFAFLSDRRVNLLPRHDDEGELLIGVRNVGPGDSLSLLLQVAEGSGDPNFASQRLRWSVLCDNYWRPLSPLEFVLDTSRDLRTSGIVAMALPTETTTSHSIMPAGLVWLRAAIPTASRSACQLLKIANNAIEVRRVDRADGSSASRASSPTSPSATMPANLPAGRIAKSTTPLAAVKNVSQPFASFGGRAAETDEMLTRRAAERLRHRQRCLTAWDYERLVLEAFPAVHKVKCIPHASETSWLAPGHVTLVVIPDLRNGNVVDPLRPRADVGTLGEIAEFVTRHVGMQVQVHVRNPRFQPVKAAFRVRIGPGLSFEFYRRELHAALIRVLSPWAYDVQRPIEFGGRVYRSTLLNFVEELPYVDFVTDFQLMAPESPSAEDQSTIQAATPDMILVSDTAHTIEEYGKN